MLIYAIHKPDPDVRAYDWYSANWSGERYTAGEVAGELFSPLLAVDYEFGP